MATDKFNLKILFAIILSALIQTGHAELNDITQTPNSAGAGINKSLEDQIGVGRGNISTPDSSIFIINRDPLRAIRRGRQIFQRKWQVAQGFGPRVNDGIGDIETEAGLGAGLADSCAACHGRPKGSAGFGGDVFTRPDSRDAPHLFGLGLIEQLADEITWDLRRIQSRALEKARKNGVPVTRALNSKGIDYGEITAKPDGTIDVAHIRGVDEDLRVKPFFAEGSEFSIRGFAVGAWAAEMGMQAADPDLNAAASGQDVVTPAGMLLSGSIDQVKASVSKSLLEDPDQDGVVNEVDPAIIDYMEFYLLNYFRPATDNRTFKTFFGFNLFKRIGCANCHIPNLLIENDRRVADVDTRYDKKQGGYFNQLFSTVTARFVEEDDNSGFPDIKKPQGKSFLVKGIFADFKRHDLGKGFYERNFDGTYQREFMTRPLWGVGSTAPYGHDGRSNDLHQVILRHGGEAEDARQRYASLSALFQDTLQQFLRSLVLFPPGDTPSNLNPKDPGNMDYPQVGHGSVRLTGLFNNPADLE